MYNPNPVPFSDLFMNFENNFENISESMPDPLSFTVTLTYFTLSHVKLSVSNSIGSFDRENFEALRIKFSRTCAILDLSISTI